MTLRRCSCFAFACANNRSGCAHLLVENVEVDVGHVPHSEQRADLQQVFQARAIAEPGYSGLPPPLRLRTLSR